MASCNTGTSSAHISSLHAHVQSSTQQPFYVAPSPHPEASDGNSEFPYKLFNVLGLVTLVDWIRWHQDGGLFIPNVVEFGNHVLRIHFPNMRRGWSSFQRQMSNYGFEKRDRNKNQAHYIHWDNKFCRDRPDLLPQVQPRPKESALAYYPSAVQGQLPAPNTSPVPQPLGPLNPDARIEFLEKQLEMTQNKVSELRGQLEEMRTLVKQMSNERDAALSISNGSPNTQIHTGLAGGSVSTPYPMDGAGHSSGIPDGFANESPNGAHNGGAHLGSLLSHMGPGAPLTTINPALLQLPVHHQPPVHYRASALPSTTDSQNPEDVSWCYKDPTGQVRGPFTASTMQTCYLNSCFTDDLLLKRVDIDPDFEELQDFKRRVLPPGTRETLFLSRIAAKPPVIPPGLSNPVGPGPVHPPGQLPTSLGPPDPFAHDSPGVITSPLISDLQSYLSPADSGAPPGYTFPQSGGRSIGGFGNVFASPEPFAGASQLQGGGLGSFYSPVTSKNQQQLIRPRTTYSGSPEQASTFVPIPVATTQSGMLMASRFGAATAASHYGPPLGLKGYGPDEKRARVSSTSISGPRSFGDLRSHTADTTTSDYSHMYALSYISDPPSVRRRGDSYWAQSPLSTTPGSLDPTRDRNKLVNPSRGSIGSVEADSWLSSIGRDLPSRHKKNENGLDIPVYRSLGASGNQNGPPAPGGAAPPRIAFTRSRLSGTGFDGVMGYPGVGAARRQVSKGRAPNTTNRGVVADTQEPITLGEEPQNLRPEQVESELIDPSTAVIAADIDDLETGLKAMDLNQVPVPEEVKQAIAEEETTAPTVLIPKNSAPPATKSASTASTPTVSTISQSGVSVASTRSAVSTAPASAVKPEQPAATTPSTAPKTAWSTFGEERPSSLRKIQEAEAKKAAEAKKVEKERAKNAVATAVAPPASIAASVEEATGSWGLPQVGRAPTASVPSPAPSTGSAGGVWATKPSQVTKKSMNETRDGEEKRKKAASQAQAAAAAATAAASTPPVAASAAKRGYADSAKPTSGATPSQPNGWTTIASGVGGKAVTPATPVPAAFNVARPTPISSRPSTTSVPSASTPSSSTSKPATQDAKRRFLPRNIKPWVFISRFYR